MIKIQKKYILPISCILFIAILCLIGYLVSHHLENPLEKTKPLGEASKVYEDQHGTKYLITEGNCTIMVIRNGKYRYSINGGKDTKSFFYARDLVVDDEGRLFVLDSVPAADGKSIGNERIIQFDKKGKYQGIVYERPHTELEKERTFYGLDIINNSLSVAEIKNAHEIHLLHLNIENSSMESDTFYSPYAVSSIWDMLTLDHDTIVYSTKNGKIIQLQKEGQEKLLFDASLHAGESYCSIPTEIEKGASDELYFVDIGRRAIYRLNLNHLEDCTVALDGMEAVACSNLPYQVFADKPIFYSFHVNADGKLNVLLNRIPEIQSSKKYAYVLYEKPKAGTLLEVGESLPKSGMLYIRAILLGLLIMLELVLFVIMFYALLKSKIVFEISGHAKFQIPIIMTAMIIAGVVSIICIQSSNQRYYETYMDKLGIVSKLIGTEITENEVNRITDASSFQREAYQEIDQTVTKILDSDQQNSGEMYCVLYRKQKEVCQIIYSDENLYGTAYPLPGNFENFVENQIYTNKEEMRFYSVATADGNNMFVLAPVFNEKNEVIALVEVGTDFYMQQQEDKALFTKLMILVVSSVVLVILVIGELIINYSLTRAVHRKGTKEKHYDAGLIRPIMFLFCFVTNMPSAFLPVYGRKLWQSGMWITPDLAGAIPISAEMGSIAIFTLLLGKTVEKSGPKKLCTYGAVIMVAANILYGVSSVWMLFTGAAILNGLGAAMLLLSINTYIMGYEDEECTRGFIHYNAAYVSGLNIGVIIGAYLAEQFGYRIPFYFGALIMICLIPIIAFCMNGEKIKSKELVNETHVVKAIWKFITSPNIWKFYLLMYIPYMCCQAFPQYYFPIFGQNNHLTTTQISMAFLLGGVLSIYLGSTVTKLMSTYVGSKKAMIVAAASLVAGLMIFGAYPTVANGFIMIALLAITDCYILTLISVYYASFREVKEIGDGVAMSIYGTMENVAMVIGPILFAFLVERFGDKGIGVYGFGFLICMILFAIHIFQIGKHSKKITE